MTASLQDRGAMERRLQEAHELIGRDERVRRVRDFLASLPPREGCVPDVDDAGCVRLPVEELSSAAREELAELLMALRPWRKGPFRIGNLLLDAEWRSEQKWSRVRPLLGDLSGLHIADVGCNNGYYLLRLLAEGAVSVTGFEPQPHYVAQYELLAGLIGGGSASLLPLGVEELGAYPDRWDLILLMGVLYHVTDPIAALRACKQALTRGGRLLLETIVVEGTGSWALTPEGRYAGARGFWHLPTLGCLETWCRRSGLRIVECGAVELTSPDEQRSTAWREGASLAEGLMPGRPELTVEGHPAPRRVAMVLTRA